MYIKRIKEEVRPCVCCKIDHKIYNRSLWLCRECDKKRKRTSLNRKTLGEENNDLKTVFQEIWETRKHNCFHCGKYLGSQPKAIFFSHILSRGAHSKLRCDPENIVLACADCHYIYDFGNRNKLERQIPEELIRKLLEKEKNEK